jgi:hypothetical protein
VYSSTMRLSTFCGLHRDTEHLETDLGGALANKTEVKSLFGCSL